MRVLIDDEAISYAKEIDHVMAGQIEEANGILFVLDNKDILCVERRTGYETIAGRAWYQSFEFGENGYFLKKEHRFSNVESMTVDEITELVSKLLPVDNKYWNLSWYLR